MPDPLISAAQLRAFAPAAPVSLAPHLSAAAVLNGITTPVRLAHFLAQVAHESVGLSQREENLNYSAERLVAVFPKYFPTLDAATPFARNPQAIANKVYGGRMGNTLPTSGWKFRGRGFLQATGYDTYVALGRLCGHPNLPNEPDWLLTDEGASESGGAFWTWRNLNPLADADNLQAITIKVNGGLNGLQDRAAWLSKARAIWRA